MMIKIKLRITIEAKLQQFGTKFAPFGKHSWVILVVMEDCRVVSSGYEEWHQMGGRGRRQK